MSAKTQVAAYDRKVAAEVRRIRATLQETRAIVLVLLKAKDPRWPRPYQRRESVE